jgi:(p)ppGpp synthase/HD superfamily hydrolase
MIEPSLYPYMNYSVKLSAVPRQGGSNMFRHQMETHAILVEFGYTDQVLLKAALIHDLLEEGEAIGFNSFDEISTLDQDGAEVLALVREVSRRVINGVNEPKSEFLKRIMLQGSEHAKILKLADRMSNINSLNQVEDKEFVSQYLKETELYIMPYAGKVNSDMSFEMNARIASIHNMFQL